MPAIDLSGHPTALAAGAAALSGDGAAFDTAMDTLRDLPGEAPWSTAASAGLLVSAYQITGWTAAGLDPAIIASSVTAAYATSAVPADPQYLAALVAAIAAGTTPDTGSPEWLVLHLVLLQAWLEEHGPVSALTLRDGLAGNAHLLPVGTPAAPKRYVR